MTNGSAVGGGCEGRHCHKILNMYNSVLRKINQYNAIYFLPLKTADCRSLKKKKLKYSAPKPLEAPSRFVFFPPVIWLPNVRERLSVLKKSCSSILAPLTIWCSRLAPDCYSASSCQRTGSSTLRVLFIHSSWGHSQQWTVQVSLYVFCLDPKSVNYLTFQRRNTAQPDEEGIYAQVAGGFEKLTVASGGRHLFIIYSTPRET